MQHFYSFHTLIAPAIISTLKMLRALTSLTLTRTRCSNIHMNLSSDSEATVNSGIISGYFVHMQMKVYILYCVCLSPMCKQGLKRNFTKKQKVLLQKKTIEGGETCTSILSARRFFFQEGGGGVGVFLNKRIKKDICTE